MNKEFLQSLFPNGTFNVIPNDDATHLIIPIDNESFHIPKTELSEREIALITELMIKKQSNTESSGHLWYDYLFNHAPLPESTHSYRIIQVQIRKDASNKKTWLAHLSELFDCIVDFFFVDDSYAILVEQQTAITYATDDIKAMLLTLEGEFLIQSTVFVGQFQLLSDAFLACFKEEQIIFQQFVSNFHPNDVFVFEDVALEYLTKKAIKDSPLMTHFYRPGIFDDETVLMIKTLWREQGNITSSAKKLYTHRNTLQYKLDKFSEQTGISLKNMTELTLCYLSILCL